MSNNLIQRILFAVPAAAFFIWMTWLGGWYFKGMLIGIGFFIIHEFIRILDNAGSPVDSLFPYTMGLWIMLSHEIPYSFEIGMGLFLLFIAVQTFSDSTNNLAELTGTFFAGFYAPIGILCLMLIDSIGTTQEGFVLTVMVMLMVWGADIFAYFGGKTFGKHPLAPHISPKKTWEGFFSGYIGSLVGAFLIFYLVPIQSPITAVQLIPMAILVATFGPIGDLMESKLKRKANMKDSSTILPGHGGFFDRFDAVLLAAPVALIYLKVIEILGYVSF